MQFEINKHEQIFSKTTKIAPVRRASAICSFWKKFTSAYLFQIAREKSCDYSLIIYMKKFEFKHETLDEKLFDLGESKVKSLEPETAKWPNVFMQHDAGWKRLMNQS